MGRGPNFKTLIKNSEKHQITSNANILNLLQQQLHRAGLCNETWTFLFSVTNHCDLHIFTFYLTS